MTHAEQEDFLADVRALYRTRLNRSGRPRRETPEWVCLLILKKRLTPRDLPFVVSFCVRHLTPPHSLQVLERVLVLAGADLHQTHALLFPVASSDPDPEAQSLCDAYVSAGGPWFAEFLADGAVPATALYAARVYSICVVARAHGLPTPTAAVLMREASLPSFGRATVFDFLNERGLVLSAPVVPGRRTRSPVVVQNELGGLLQSVPLVRLQCGGDLPEPLAAAVQDRAAAGGPFGASPFEALAALEAETLASLKQAE